MVRKFLLLCLVFILSISIYAQVPDAFKYQAVIRNSSGEILQNQDVSIQISILDGSATGTNVFTESHLVTTSNSGLININIGKGTVESGDFGTINWASGDKYLKVEIDETGGSTYTDLGAIELLSIPYALYANDVANKDDADADSTNEIQDLNLTDDVLTVTNHPSPTEINLSAYQGTNTDEQELTLLGDTLIISNGNEVVLPYDSSNWVIQGNTMYYNGGNVGIGSSAPLSNLEVKSNTVGSDALFQVINANNDTVFAVYPDGVKIFIDPEAKGRVGGFAISGRSPSKAGEVEYMRVTTDSTRIYVNEPIDGKGSVGGFAISGRSPSKGIVNDYLVVTGDSTRIYVNDSLTVKGRVGGFAISGRSPSKGTINDYLQVTRDSTRVFVTESSTKGSVGGFAISGRSPSKGTEKDYFNVSGNLNAQTIDPSEARIFWYPKKEAFLTGRVLVESSDSVGTNSMATGFESKSIGDYSQALGYKARAKGDNSTAIGYNANTIGEASYALGNFATAQDSGSYAIGSGATASGLRSFALGSTGVDSAGIATSPTMAIADYAYAFGMGSLASAQGAFAFGTQDTASGEYSTALGYQTKANKLYDLSMGYKTTASGGISTAMGYKTTASGTYSTAMGRLTTASGFYSTAMGEGTLASGFRSTAMGQGTTASGDISTAMGYYTTASGYISTTMGYKTTASSSYSTAMGYKTTAIGFNSTAIGTGTKASGWFSTALGNTTTASGFSSTSMGIATIARSHTSIVIGRYNDTLTTSSLTTWVDTDPLFIIGNGTAEGSRHNAVTVLKNGNVGIGTIAPSELLTVYNETTTGTYTISGWQHSSDERLKTNIQKIPDALEKVSKIKGVYFNWKSNIENRQVGFIAQDIENVIPEVVSKNNEGYYSITYGSVTPILVEAIKEQQKIIEDQKSDITELKARLTQIEELLNKE